jgi:PEP-CTERM/exosortase A-associated glycosyltransferase
MRATWEDAAVSHGTAREGGVRYLASRALETFVLRRTDAVVTICEGLRREVVARGVDADRVTVVPNAVDAAQFTVARERDARLAEATGVRARPTIGFIGSFYDYEGLELLIAATARVRASLPDVALLLVGGGPAEAELRACATRANVADCVVFSGRVPHDDVMRYYSLVDVLAYPRKPIRLTELVTPLKPLEAMALGKVLVASNVGGHRELIRHGETGYLFQAGDCEALALELLEILRNRERQEPVRLQARQFVEHERTWRRSVERYAPIYERLARRVPHTTLGQQQRRPSA